MDTYGYLWIPMDSYGVVAKLEASPIFDKSHGFNLSKGRGLGGRWFDFPKAQGHCNSLPIVDQWIVAILASPSRYVYIYIHMDYSIVYIIMYYIIYTYTL